MAFVCVFHILCVCVCVIVLCEVVLWWIVPLCVKLVVCCVHFASPCVCVFQQGLRGF